MLEPFDTFSKKTLLDIAEKMAIAARTAPKGKGVDLLELSIARGETIRQIARRMQELGEQFNSAAMQRDSKNIENCDVVFLAGTRVQPLGIAYCGLCGFADCATSTAAGSHCAFNTGDLGIAIGSAASIAADHRVDTRIMYTIGMAVVDLKLMPEDVAIVYGIPLSATGKNPFFDRQ